MHSFESRADRVWPDDQLEIFRRSDNSNSVGSARLSGKMDLEIDETLHDLGHGLLHVRPML